MSTATTFLKLNYLDKVNTKSNVLRFQQMNSILKPHTLKIYENLVEYAIRKISNFAVRFFSAWSFRNESGIEYHRSIRIVCYNHFNSGSVYIVLSTHEKASEASRCHSSGKFT